MSGDSRSPDPNEASTPVRFYLDLMLERLPLRLAKLRATGLQVEAGVRVKSPSRLILGRGVVIQSDSILHCGGKDWCGLRGEIALEDHVVVGPRCVLYGAGGIHIGAFTHLGPGAMLISQSGRDGTERMSPNPNFTFEPIRLGRGNWIGAGAIVLGGTVLGDGCSVSPNAVVKGEYPAGTILVGNPARPSLKR